MKIIPWTFDKFCFKSNSEVNYIVVNRNITLNDLMEHYVLIEDGVEKVCGVEY